MADLIEYTVEFTVTVRAPRVERAAMLAWEYLADRLEYHHCTVIRTIADTPGGPISHLEFCPSVEQQAGEGETPYAENWNE